MGLTDVLHLTPLQHCVEHPCHPLAVALDAELLLEAATARSPHAMAQTPILQQIDDASRERLRILLGNEVAGLTIDDSVADRPLVARHHGQPCAHRLKDDQRLSLANLTTGQFKSGAGVKDIFRTMSTGLSGTPMPSFSDSLPEADRWALSYYVLALSAFTDPLTGEKMKISQKDRDAINDPALKASESHYAYKSQNTEQATLYAGDAWAKKHGFDSAAARDSTAGIKQRTR